MNPLDILADLLEYVRSLIASQPCKCSVGEGGLRMCKRCVLLKM